MCLLFCKYTTLFQLCLDVFKASLCSVKNRFIKSKIQKEEKTNKFSITVYQQGKEGIIHCEKNNNANLNIYRIQNPVLLQLSKGEGQKDRAIHDREQWTAVQCEMIGPLAKTAQSKWRLGWNFLLLLVFARGSI